MRNNATHPEPENDGEIIAAILAVPAYREQFADALVRSHATPGTKDEPEEIERRLQLLRR